MFRTELTIAPQERQLSRTARVLTVGSCFADSIGERLRLNKVQALVNPFGTVFQPLALAQLLRAAAGEEQDWQQHVVEARGRWQSYDFHSTIGAESPVELLQTIQETVRRVGDFVRTADTVVLTLGTAWAYRLRETGELVSNLHKLPTSLFEKELLTADEIVNGLAEVHALLRRLNPAIHIVLTVSPVRHLKETLPLNAVSKSVLRVACHYLSELLPGVSYFPAYELLTDDLRDYRFYAADMLHPSESAEDYIWDRFARAYFDADFGRFRKEWAAVRQSLGHRPLHAGAPEHRIFLDQTRERLERLANQGVEVRQELRDVQRQLAALPPPKPVRVVEAVLDDEERIDIGEGATALHEASDAQASETAAQPQERRRDTRRDGRRNDRSGRDRRNGQPAVTAPNQEIATEASELPIAEALVTPVEPLVTASEGAEPSATEEVAGYPAKKKKRRSRGGAKRTARKNAARLASEQEGTQPGNLAEEELLEEQALEVADFLVEQLNDELLETANAGNEPSQTTETTTGDVTAPLISPATKQTALVRKRGTGPTPKTSKVITKSGVVKRGQRTSLYRAPIPAPQEEAAPPLATAPIISSPIISEILMERPAVEFAETPQQPTEPDLAATVLGLYSSKPHTPTAAPKPKRGRPKAPSTASTTSAIAPATNAPEPASEVATEADVAPDVPAKAPATRGAKAAKPATPKKPAAKSVPTKKVATKPATPRRGRPPGKPTPPPAAETPTT